MIAKERDRNGLVFTEGAPANFDEVVLVSDPMIARVPVDV